ncbi:MAG: AMP-binding protein, partial [bacterium]|nr:AMP-binding protein [bacterium]
AGSAAEQAGSAAVTGELGFWESQAEEDGRELPVDHPGGVNTLASARGVTVSLPAEETRALLKEVHHAYRTRINDVLLAALVQAFGEWTGRPTLLVEMEGHGREELDEELDLSRTVGWFTSIFPVLLERVDDPGGLLKGVKERLRAIPGGGVGYGLLRYLNEETAQRLRDLPPAAVVFNYLGQLDVALPPGSALRPAVESAGSAIGTEGQRRSLLEINGGVADGCLRLTWTYSENLHRRATIEALAAGFLEALRGLIRHCLSPGVGGLTPSDFPETGLDQARIDQLVAELGGGFPDAIYALSPVQQGMLFHSLYAPDSGVYVEQLSVRLRGDLDVSIFARAWQHVVDHHAILRTSFHWEALDKPVQVVHRKLEVGIERGSWRELSPEDERRRLSAFLSADRDRGFELGTAPLMRLALFELGEGTFQFIWSFHHLYLDGWSQALILGDMFRCYAALSQGRPVSLPRSRPYRDYIAWLDRQDLEEAESYWQELLRDFTAPTLLGRRQDASPGEHGDYREFALRLSAASSSALQSLARGHRLTLNTLLQGAWAVLLGRYSGQDDVVFGATLSGRPAELPGVESIAGLFINTLPVRVKVDPGELLVPWLERFQAQQTELQRWEYSPLDQVQKWSDLPAGRARFDHILVFESYPVSSALRESPPGLEISEAQPWEQTNYPLTVVVLPGSEMKVELRYDSRDFDPTAVVRMAGHFENLLQAFVDDPGRRLVELALLTPAERQQLLVEWNDTAGPYPRESAIHELFEAQAARRPEAVAVVLGEAQVSYGELNRRANQLAHHLRSCGVGPEVCVGLCVERSLEMVLAILGTLKAGGTYVPLDPSYPSERLAFM